MKVSRISRLQALTLLMTITVLTVGYVYAEDTPSGTVEFEEKAFAIILGGESGQGTLNFQGEAHPFKLSGLSAGGAGYSEVKAKGDVYNLNDVADFAGTYGEGKAGITVAEGAGGFWMQNDKGVSLHITSDTEGLALGLGAGAVTIEMTE
jgi:hypothetical protein